MKIRGIIVAIIMVLLMISTVACNGDKDNIPPETIEGDSNIIITGEGNIEALYHEKLTFGSGGKVAEIPVQEGDTVNKGDILAKLDTDDLELALTEAQLGEFQARQSIAQAKFNETQANLVLTEAKYGVTQAEVALESAKYNLDRMEEVDKIKDDITDAEYEIKIAEMRLQEANYLGVDVEAAKYWTDELLIAQETLAEAQQDLAELLAEDEYTNLVVDEVIIKQLQVKAAEESLQIARLSVNQAQQALELVELSIEQAQKSLEKARHTVVQAQKNIDEATIIAPFSGIVANIGVREGEFLSPAAYTETTVIELIDTKQMELTARFDELDIVQLKTEQEVMVIVDAIPNTVIGGKITFISPVARDLSGIVLFEDEDEEKTYEVKIAFDNSDNLPIMAGMNATAEILTE